MARIAARVFPLVSRYSPIHTSPPIASSLGWRPADVPTSSSALSSGEQLLNFSFGAPRRGFHVSSSYSRHPGPFSSVFPALRGFRKARRRQAAMKQVPEEKKLELRVKISVEEGMPEDHEVVNVAEMLKLNAPMAMKMTFDGIKELDFRVQDSSIDNIGGHEKIDLSILLCNDVFISKLHKEWRGVDCPTDVLCRFQQEILGDIVISAEAAARQAKERGHSLLDEVRILMVQGLLHLVGFDQESVYRARVEMGKLEELVLRTLGWKARGHARDIDHVATSGFRSKDVNDKIINPRERLQDLRFYRPKFSYIFCDMDGTLLNSQSQVSITTAEALREVLARGVKIIIATGKTRPAVISALKMVGLAGKNGVASEVSPGIFLQGLLVYGRNGREIHRRSLDQNVCREALFYSLEHEVPLVAFCQDRCLTLFEHPLVDSLHTVYHEPKAEVIPSVEHLLAAADIQKLIFLDTADGVSSVLRPYWEETTNGRAGVVQAQPDMLEIIPAGTTKGEGVRVLLHHLGISPKEIMAIGDGENDVEMLKLASLGVALGNGSEKAKAVADVIGATNDEDGVAMAIYRYAF